MVLRLLCNINVQFCLATSTKADFVPADAADTVDISGEDFLCALDPLGTRLSPGDAACLLQCSRSSEETSYLPQQARKRQKRHNNFVEARV